MRTRLVQKFYPKGYRPVCRYCATSIVTTPGDVYVLLVETAVFSTNVETLLRDSGTTSAKEHETSRSRSGGAFGLSRTSPGESVSMNSTDAGSEAGLIDILLFAAISSELLSRGRSFERDKLLTYFFRHAASQEVFYFLLSVLLAQTVLQTNVRSSNSPFYA